MVTHGHRMLLASKGKRGGGGGAASGGSPRGHRRKWDRFFQRGVILLVGCCFLSLLTYSYLDLVHHPQDHQQHPWVYSNTDKFVLDKTWWQNSQAQQVVKKDRQGNVLHHNITAIHKEDLAAGLIVDAGQPKKKTTWSLDDVRKDREELLDLLQDAGVQDMDSEVIASLPTWEQVKRLYGDGPVVIGLDTCEQYQTTVPKNDASIATAGLFNTGTNPLAMYLAANCKMPENTKEKYGGMRWQVPWGKHMMASRKWNNTAQHDEKVHKANVFPVVLIRDFYSWAQSMCKHPYAASWNHDAKRHCPNLVPTEKDRRQFAALKHADSVPVHIPYPGLPAAQWDSLAHLWSDWYNQYLNADYPRLMIRFEDLIFHPKKVIATVCQCAGAVPKEDHFSYVVDAGKWGQAHVGSSNMITAMAKYGTDALRFHNLTRDDLEFARQHVDPQLMSLFHYQQPAT